MLVFKGIKPASLSRVQDPEVKQFIETCLLPASERLSAKELLLDPFLQVNGLTMNNPLPLPDIVMPKEGAFGERCLMSEGPPTTRCSRSMSIDLDEDNNLPIVTFSDNSGSRCIEVRRAKRGNFFVLKGEENDEHSVSLILRIVDENGKNQLQLLLCIMILINVFREIPYDSTQTFFSLLKNSRRKFPK